MSYNKISDYYKSHLQNAFDNLYNVLYNGDLGKRIALSDLNSNAYWFNDLATSPNSFTIDKLGQRYVCKCVQGAGDALEDTFDTPLNEVWFEATFVFPDKTTDYVELFFQRSGGQTWGVYGNNAGLYLPKRASQIAVALHNTVNNEPVKFKIYYKKSTTNGFKIYANDELKYEFTTDVETITNTVFKFYGTVYMYKLDASWIDTDYVDFAKYLYNLQYQVGPTGDTGINYKIGFRFTQESIFSSINSSSTLTERLISLELNWHTNYANLNRDLYSLNQLQYYLEVEFAKIPNANGVSIDLVDQQIIETNLDESSCIIKNIYSIIITEQHNLIDQYVLE